MWNNKARYWCRLLLKNIQFKWSTWRQGRAIARAYGERRPLRLPHINKRVIAASFAAAAVVAAVYFGAPYAAKGYGAAAAIVNNVRHSFTVKKNAPMAAASRPSSPRPQAKQTPALPEAPPRPAGDRAEKAAEARGDSTREKTLPPSAGEKKPVRSMNYCIVANKADRTLFLLNDSEGKGTWKSVENYSILIGRNEGRKIAEGDSRTPEGTYFIIGRKESEELNPIYGPLAYVLNYPNEEDRKAGRTGQGIWIHGTREDTTREATRGCIVLDNNDVLSLSRYLQLGIGTPVLIVNTPNLTQPHMLPNTEQLRALRRPIVAEYAARHDELREILGQWKQAWESRNIDAYARFYDAQRFSGEGMRWDAWRDKKEHIFKAYSTISVGVDKMCVSEFSESTSVVLFMQRYESETMHLQRPKKLSFIKNDGQWKIYKEETFSRQELLL